ncbi:ABC transporter permease [Arcanobacterium pinnipediorum]|uniref:ABC transporter permease subunit n=1 Tax=Arcanobacterium pinnipediorum TaxID=1503041 RepID=A0ABY5AHK2_9ACTO|nr:ABC transporter permease subunit [Arcanobacterium pinnipediorum]USR79674.1 ABC transporter permease subunit [Arcanobacterium pinnipediorum]
MMGLANRRIKIAITVLAVSALLVGWEIYVKISEIDALTLPAPTGIAQALIHNYDSVIRALYVTGCEVIIGISCGIIVGMLVAYLMFIMRGLTHLMHTLLVISQTIPIIAIAPLLIIWFGFGLTNKILLVAVYTFFPVAISFLKGLGSATLDQIDVARTLGACRWWRLIHLHTPAAAGQLFSGIKIAVTYAPATAALAEYVGARQGLGIMLISAQASFRTDLVFVVAFVLMAMSVLLYGTATLVESVVVKSGKAESND